MACPRTQIWGTDTATKYFILQILQREHHRTARGSRPTSQGCLLSEKQGPIDREEFEPLREEIQEFF
jgi:hypothetical protein